MWERLSADGGIHDKTIGFDWQHAFETKVFILNAAAFASHTDWRLPNRRSWKVSLTSGSRAPRSMRPSTTDALRVVPASGHYCNRLRQRMRLTWLACPIPS
jgi:hypothetical protein